MTSYPLIDEEPHEVISAIRFDDFDVSWAGSGMRADQFCFGSEDGRLLFTDINGVVKAQPQPYAPSGEAINGVAFIRPNQTSVSTRADVTSWTRIPGSQSSHATTRLGAHGVVAGKSHFLAPLGDKGLLWFRPVEGAEQPFMISNSRENPCYYYSLVSVSDHAGHEIIACASRRSGVVVTEFRGEEPKQDMNAITFHGLDVVDLCPLQVPMKPAAVAALGRDGTLVCFGDVLQDVKNANATTIKYDAIQGTAYRVLSARGHLFVLTSNGLYVLAGFVSRFAKSSRTNPVTPILELPMEAVDANLVGDRWLLIVMPDEVLRFDIELFDTQVVPQFLHRNGAPENNGGLMGMAANKFRPESPKQLNPDWTRSESANHLETVA